VEQTMQAMRETRHTVLYGDWRACAGFDQREQAQSITAPTWVIVGSEDRITPMAYAHFLTERIPAARLDVVNGAGHMVFLEQPARVAQGLQQFLNALAATRYSAARVRAPAPAPTPAKTIPSPAARSASVPRLRHRKG
jgi:alpha-beta hydrolase superfamily lysophospholipase